MIFDIFEIIVNLYIYKKLNKKILLYNVYVFEFVL